MGYDLNELLREIDSTGMSLHNVFSDGIAMTDVEYRILNYLRMLYRVYLKKDSTRF